MGVGVKKIGRKEGHERSDNYISFLDQILK